MVADSTRSRIGFTLIELLVVIGIISILATILLVAVGMLGDSSKEELTRSRIQNVMTGLRANHPGEGLLDVIQDALTPEDLRWDTLRRVVSNLTKLESNPLDLQDPTHIYEDSDPLTGPPNLPPHIYSMYDRKIGNVIGGSNNRAAFVPLVTHPEEGVAAGSTLQRVLLFGHYASMAAGEFFAEYENAADTALRPPMKWPQWFASGSNKYRVRIEQGESRTTSQWVSRDLGLISDSSYSIVRFEGATTDEDLKYAKFYYQRSPLGETIDSTLEIMSDSLWDRQTYYDHWPYMVEYLSEDDILVQHAWPNSDWDQESPGTIPPIWEMPFGRKVISQRDNEIVDQYLRRFDDDEGRHLGEFSPLATIALLQAAGILEPGEEGAKAYRTDRNPDKDWNDAWGNPLVVGAALFIAPRHDTDPDFANHDSNPSSYDKADLSFNDYAEYWKQIDSAGKTFPHMFVSTMQGGRDWLMRRIKEAHDNGRMAYIAVGAMGKTRKVHGEENTIATQVAGWNGAGKLPEWSADKDPFVLRAAWLQITERCEAETFDETAYEDPPWSGVTKDRTSTGTVMLSSPEVIK